MHKDHTVRVAWDDTDCTKRIYLGKYIKWLDDAATEFLRGRGLVFDMEGWLWLDGNELNESFVVGEYSMRMFKTSGFDEVLTIKLSVKERRSRVIVFKGDIHDEKGDLCASGTLTYIYIKRRAEPAGRQKKGKLNDHRPGPVVSPPSKPSGTPIVSTDIPENIAKLLPVGK
jgi:YbgC/YbaW family acyl-CoA thioester hydrolase